MQTQTGAPFLYMQNGVKPERPECFSRFVVGSFMMFRESCDVRARPKNDTTVPSDSHHVRNQYEVFEAAIHHTDGQPGRQEYGIAWSPWPRSAKEILVLLASPKGLRIAGKLRSSGTKGWRNGQERRIETGLVCQVSSLPLVRQAGRISFAIRFLGGFWLAFCCHQDLKAPEGTRN